MNTKGYTVIFIVQNYILMLPNVRLCLRAFSTHSDPSSMPCCTVASTGTGTRPGTTDILYLVDFHSSFIAI